MANKELRESNNAVIQGMNSGIGIAAILKAAEGDPGVQVSVMQDEVMIRPRSMPTPLQMEIRANMMNQDELARKIFGE